MQDNSNIFSPQEAKVMPKLTSANAGKVIKKTNQTIRRKVHAGELQAWREGPSGKMWIEVEDLRRFAAANSYRFDVELANKLAEE